MVAATMDWTAPLAITGLRADPSGVLDASTTFQATIFPGMSTVTLRLRYISLFAAARYYRMQVGEQVGNQLPLPTYLRRLEALIAVSTVLHHRADGNLPTGIVGRGAGVAMSRQSEVVLQTNLRQFPYSIYRGTLAALDIVDTSRPSDPLYEGARALGEAWDPAPARVLGIQLRAGILPERVAREDILAAAPAFCLCAVPDGSLEQATVTRLLFMLDWPGGPQRRDDQLRRSTAWRFLLELVRLSPHERLLNEALVARMLRADLLEVPLPGVLRRDLFLWRWVAARTFFERGWTLLFARTLRIVRAARDGLTQDGLRRDMERDYLAGAPTEPLGALMDEARASCEDPGWLAARFVGRTPRDALLGLLAGLVSAQRDRERAPAEDSSLRDQLNDLWTGGTIPPSTQFDRVQTAIPDGIHTHQFWATVAEESLVQHVRTSLRKMSAGNPDSLLIDFAEGCWSVPGKATAAIDSLGIATARTRLDVALGWAEQLGLVHSQGGVYALTARGEECGQRWDREYGGWA